MKTPYPQPAIRPPVSFGKLLKFQLTGRYDEALAEVRPVWPDLSAQPETLGLEPRETAEMLLRCGSLIGFLGHAKQLPNAQERSKDLLTEAHGRFLDIYDTEKIAECENFLALAYWRTGELNEATAWVEAALAHSLPDTNHTRLYCQVTRLLINLEAGRFTENVALFKKLEPLFRTNGDAFLCGCFYSNTGIAYQELGDQANAIKYLELAESWHVRSRHKIYLGTAKNNLAMLYKNFGEFEKAHAAIDSAIKIFRQIKDRTREGYGFDTKAQVHFVEGRYAEAVKAIEKALPILQMGENSAYLIETYMTKVRSLVFMDDISEAAYCLTEAVGIARRYTGDDSAKTLTKRFESALKERFSTIHHTPPRIENSVPVPAGEIQLVLPAAIGHYTDYEGVWITGSHLEHVGIVKGSLAVVVRERVKRGDLVAIAEKGSDMVRCGFYDTDFGMVSLEGVDSEPQLFDEDEVRVIGRIVGVCNSGRSADGKMFVEEINI